MSSHLDIAVSPYHLATREPPAMAALLLGSTVLTLLPHPAAGTSREAVFEAVQKSPRYLRLLESWRWSTPLWKAGIISAAIQGQTPGDSLEAVYRDVKAVPGFANLRPLLGEMDRLRDENSARFLDAVSHDLLRGGPDPGISIPINAALERFSADHGLVLARGAVSSIAQRAETRLGSKLFSVGIPVLLQAGGQTVLALREDLEESLEGLRAVILDTVSAGVVDSARLHSAVAEYVADFSHWVDAGLAAGDDEDGQRVVPGFVGLMCMRMPADAVLRSSGAAVRSMGGAGGEWGGGGAWRNTPSAPSSSAAEPAFGRFTLIIREMNIKPEAA